MKVVHIQSADIQGGAGVAAYRLHKGLRSIGVDSWFLSPTKIKSDPYSKALKGKFKFLSNIIGRVTFRMGLNFINKIDSFLLPFTEPISSADIIHIHNVHDSNGGFFNYLAIPLLSRNKSIFWTLHDCWPVTGHCAYSGSCSKYTSGCGSCPDLNTYPAIKHDSTRLEWKIKQKSWMLSDVNFIAPSRWMKRISETGATSKCSIHNIPYGIDNKIFIHHDKLNVRDELGLPRSAAILLILGSTFSVARKGALILPSILEKLSAEIPNLFLISFGSIPEWASRELPFQHRHFGNISDDEFKNRIYSAADLFLFPSLEDNLPVSVQESLASGTSVVAFDVGGMVDLIEDGQNGFLSPLGDVDSLVKSAQKILKNAKLAISMGHNAREGVKRKFCIPDISSQISYLYRQAIKNK
jgi:glycosyltransferase involved in cell wall biosynthesis